MQLNLVLAGLALASGALATPKPGACDSNNCARAVTGTRTGKMPDVTSRWADCSSFQQVTVTPATSTITETTTVTVTDILAKRQAGGGPVTVSPTGVPAYASACSGASAYSSACSCWGVTATTITVATPTTTVTVTATVTVSACPAGKTLCGGVCQDLLSDPNNCGSCGNSCPSGVCLNGQCSVPSCAGSTCNSLNSCGDGDCFCFATADGTGFCGPSESCAPLPDCTSTSECQEGWVCATGTCCGRNVCIQGCGVPLRRRDGEMEARDNVTGLFTDGFKVAKLAF